MTVVGQRGAYKDSPQMVSGTFENLKYAVTEISIADFLAKEDISISYLYSFLLKGKGVLIFRTDNTEKAQEAIDRNGLKVIEEKDISKLL